MDRMLALAAFVLSLLGCEPQRSVFESRAIGDGRDLLHARASIESGVARFDCLASTTGLCYWTVHPAGCTGDSGTVVAPCAAAASRRFALAVDDSRHLPGVASARVCVADRAGAASPACHEMGVDAR